MNYQVGIGKKSRRFLPDESSKHCKIGGLHFENVPGFSSESDGDVVLQSICNAITSITSIPILGGIAADLCRKDGITDSGVYLKKAFETLKGQTIQHVALSIEGKRPRLQERIDEMRKTIAKLLHIDMSQVGITVSTGDGLTDVGCGDGLQCSCIITVQI